MTHAVVDKNFCIVFLRCISACKKGCLELSGMTNSQGYDYVQFKEGSACIACGLCYQVCPDVAITVYKEVAS